MTTIFILQLLNELLTFHTPSLSETCISAAQLGNGGVYRLRQSLDVSLRRTTEASCTSMRMRK